MKYTGIAVAMLFTASATLFAQGGPGPRHGGFGPEGFGPGGFGPGFGPGFGMMMKTPVTGAPYSGTQTTQIQRVLTDGNQISRNEQAKVYRDSQGRVRMERTMTNPGNNLTHTMISIFDPVGGFAYMLNPNRKTAVKMSLPQPPSGASAQGCPRCGQNFAQGQSTDLGTQTINGLPATGTRITDTIPAGKIGNQQPIQIVRETWISTTLKVPVEIKSTDPRFGNSTMELTNVALTEPDPALFQVPADYTVTTRERGMGMGMGRGMGPRGMRGNAQQQ